MDQADNIYLSACWARLSSFILFILVPKNIFGYVIIPSDLYWPALCVTMMTIVVISAQCVMICDCDDDQSLLLPTSFYVWWMQIFCLPTSAISIQFPNDKYK
jgi:hypothetical protein